MSKVNNISAATINEVLGFPIPVESELGMRMQKGKGRKKRKVDSDEEDSEDQRSSGVGPFRPSGLFKCIEVDINAMKELLKSLPRPPLEGASLRTIVGRNEAYRIPLVPCIGSTWRKKRGRDGRMISCS
ncbi:hypothetical protein HAX54_038118 [Datura stramonium]|uniref:Uncharacterized protein n=1 Tax=Datura stramonium TaxID=4076 RepID=A0ABS8VMC8_DATST|nr:hypothetical protein [Datura stramonium]